jgi:hypothetical protein
MEAIVKVSKLSHYSSLNGKTYPVKEVLSTGLALSINNITVDFSFNEVIIVHIEKEMQAAYDDYRAYGKDSKGAGLNFYKLELYCRMNRFDVIPKLNYGS